MIFQKFNEELRREVQAYPRFALLLLVANALFVGFCVGRIV